MRLAVLRVGPVDVNIAKTIQKSLRKAFPEVTCSVLEQEMSIPQGAYSSRRRQYNSSKILMRLRNYVQDLDADRILGVTDVDLYAAGLNFVFGEAECPGIVAIISLSRLRQEFYGHASDRRLFAERCVKEAVHEVGHTVGLSHCRDSSCVMFFSNSILDTDRKGESFCDRCSGLIVRRLKRS